MARSLLRTCRQLSCREATTVVMPASGPGQHQHSTAGYLLALRSSASIYSHHNMPRCSALQHCHVDSKAVLTSISSNPDSLDLKNFWSMPNIFRI